MSFLSQTKPGMWSTMEGTFTYRSRPLFLSRTIGEPAEDYDSFFFFSESWKTAKTIHYFVGMTWSVLLTAS